MLGPVLLVGKRGSASLGGEEDKRSLSGGRGVEVREEVWDERGGGGRRGGVDVVILSSPLVASW